MNHTIEYAKDLQWCNKEHTRFDCIVKFQEIKTEVPCTIDPADTFGHIQQLWQRGIAGEFGPIAEIEESVNT
jgi:hypothetical protein